MNKIKKIKNYLLAGSLFLPLNVAAQQVIADYNVLDNGGILSVSSEANQTIGYLNDKNEQTAYEQEFTSDSWIQYRSHVPVVVTAYNLVAHDDEKCDPISIRLEGSEDGKTWRTLDSKFGIEFPGRFENITYSLTNTTPYIYYRLTIREIQGNEKFKIAELQLFGFPYPELDDLINKGEGILTAEYAGNSNEGVDNLSNANYSSKYKQDGTKSLWVQYELDEPVKLESYSLVTTSRTALNNNLRTWKVLGSNDGENWDVLDVRSNKYPFEVDNNMQVYEIANDRKRNNWTEYADFSQESMIDLFWKQYGSGTYLTHSYHPNPDLVNIGYNYWWMAHVIEVLVDGYNRTEDNAYKTRMNNIYSGALAYGQRVYGRNDLWNGFFDDMEWMGLACLRAYEATEVIRWKENAIQLWDWIKLGWNDIHGGGIQWVDSQPSSKNACSNAPAIILAARLYNETGEEEYLDWAVRIFDWMNENLIFEDTGMVKDGYGNDNFEGWTLTYNQGTWIGACLELYKITEAEKYYDIAMRTADYVVNDRSKFSPNGILFNNEGGGDGGLFKGIFMRYLSQWILSGKLDEKRQNEFVSYFIENGKSLWETATRKPEIIFHNTWMQRPQKIQEDDARESGYDASKHLSGVMLFELLDEMERHELLPADSQNPEAVANAQNEYRFFRLSVESNYGGNNIELTKWQLNPETPTDGIEKGNDNYSASCYIIGDRGKITINNPEQRHLYYRIYNLNGKCILQSGFSDSDKDIELTGGVYIVSVSDNGIKYSQKVIVK